MSYQTTQNEMSHVMHEMPFTAPASLPLSFRMGEREVRGIPDGFGPQVRAVQMDRHMTETTLTGCLDGLGIEAQVLQYSDFPVVEVTAFLKNQGQADTEVLSDILALNWVFSEKRALLQYSNGETISDSGFVSFEQTIEKEPFTLSTADSGTSCYCAFPFFRLKGAHSILTCAIGWSGDWRLTLIPEEQGIRLQIGQKYTHFRIRPGEVMRTPRVCLLLSQTDDEDRAINLWRRFYFCHVMPKQWGRNLPPKLCAHVFGYRGNEFTGATTDNQLAGMARYLARGIRPDLWWFDAAFYACGGDWPLTGTWRVDDTRFPATGMRPIGDACRENGMDFMVWFEPERVTPGSELDREHPEFLLRYDRRVERIDWHEWNSMLHYGHPQALSYMIDRIDGLIKQWGITVYRQDFNFSPFSIWRKNEAPDRLGALENQHIQGYYRFFDELLLRNPGLVIDSCASGGRRNDLETLRRAVSFQYTDFGCGDPAQKERQHLLLFEWMPYFRAHTYGAPPSVGVDEFTWLTAFAPAVTFTAPCWGEEADFVTARRMIPIWRQAAALMLRGDYHRQMQVTYGQELRSFFCVHFYDPCQGDGMVLYLRNVDCEEEAFTAKLAVEGGYDYELSNPLTGECFVKNAAELKELTVTLEKHQGTIWFLQRIK